MITPDLPRPSETPPILVVDDEEAMLMAIRESLRSLGYPVVTMSEPMASARDQPLRASA